MPRPPRAFFDGLYHIGSHASDDRELFLSDAERCVFLDGLGAILDRFELGLVAYTLMDNHYHAVLRVPDARVSRALQRLHTWYSRLHNKLHGRNAHLFRAHPFARELESDEDLLTTCRYVAWNPVEAGLAADPLAWPWSSVAATAGRERSRVQLHVDPLRDALGARRSWQREYLAFIAPPAVPEAA